MPPWVREVEVLLNMKAHYKSIDNQAAEDMVRYYEGIHIPKQPDMIIKVKKQYRKKEIQREIDILQILSGGPNVVDCWCNPRQSEHYTKPGVWTCQLYRLSRLYPPSRITMYRYYLSNSQGAKVCHEKGIIHQNCETTECMIDPELRRASNRLSLHIAIIGQLFWPLPASRTNWDFAVYTIKARNTMWM